MECVSAEPALIGFQVRDATDSYGRLSHLTCVAGLTRSAFKFTQVRLQLL
jgi:hypothetical protein